MSEKNAKKDNKRISNSSAQISIHGQNRIRSDVSGCLAGIRETLRRRRAYTGSSHSRVYDDARLAAFLVGKAAESGNPAAYDYANDSSLDADIISAAHAARINSIWKDLIVFLDLFPAETFYAAAALQQDDSNPNATPEGVRRLAEALLDVRSGEKFIDLGCGSGTVAFEVKAQSPEPDVYAVDIDPDCTASAKVTNALTEHKITIETKDMFQLAAEQGKPGSFDKVFSNYPLGNVPIRLTSGRDYASKLRARIPDMPGAAGSDWIFNSLMAELTTEDGKAVGIMTTGSTWNMLDIQARQYFVEKGLIECVILLPEKIFPIINTPAAAMIVMSHNNKGVRLVDATKLCSSGRSAGRRINELSEDNISQILKAVREDSEISMFIDPDALRNNEYILNLSRYTETPDKVEDGRAFRDIIKRITRGAPQIARALDELASETPTDMQYLMIQNVQEGIIDSRLPYLKEIPENSKRYCLKDRCLIISKNGFPYKIAVADIKDGRQILANGNLYIIELDEDIADPYYVAAYLTSEQGMAALKRISGGATLLNIGVEQLKELMIPVPSMEKQRKIAAEYKAARDEIRLLQTKLEEAKARFAHAYDQGRNE